MKAIILCAGYGTRLYPLTINTPKALLEVKGKKLLDLLVENISKVKEVDEIVLVSNGKFFDHFMTWKNESKFGKKIRVLNNGTFSESEQLGANEDLRRALKKIKYSGEIMVLAGDNYFNFKLKDFYNFYLKNLKKSVVLGSKTKDETILHSHAVANLDERGKILLMEEKPSNPKGDFAVGPFYIYNENDTKKLEQFLMSEPDKKRRDAPGYFAAWLSKNSEVFAYDISPCYSLDIGTPQVYYDLNNKINELSQKSRDF